MHLLTVRCRDIIVLQGAPLMGVAFAAPVFAKFTFFDVAVLLLANLLLLIHIFSLNDWAGASSDFGDPNKAYDTFLTRGISKREMGFLSLISGGLSLMTFSLLPMSTFVLASAISLLGILYSHPNINGKAIPVFSSCLHLLGGTLHFLLGYSLFRGIDLRGMLISFFFAIVFTAGHLAQEVGDYESDIRSGILTNGVKFGQHRIFLISFILFSLSFGYLWSLVWYGFVPAPLAYVLLLYPLQAALFWRAYSGGLTFNSINRLRFGYRLIYAGVGLAAITALFFQ